MRDHVGRWNDTITGSSFRSARMALDYQVLLSLHNSIGDESHSCFVVGETTFSMA